MLERVPALESDAHNVSMTSREALSAAVNTESQTCTHTTFDRSKRRILMLTPRLSEDLMKYRHGEHWPLLRALAEHGCTLRFTQPNLLKF
jgi:hypothetical protein